MYTFQYTNFLTSVLDRFAFILFIDISMENNTFLNSDLNDSNNHDKFKCVFKTIIGVKLKSVQVLYKVNFAPKNCSVEPP